MARAAIPTVTAGPTCRNSRRSPARIRAASSAATWRKARSTRSSRPRSTSSTPTRRPRKTLVRIQPEGQTERTIVISVPSLTRVTLSTQTLGALTTAPFSTLIEADRPLVVDRTMSWDGSGYGSHAETAVEAPSTTWYLAEGSTVRPVLAVLPAAEPERGDRRRATITFLRPAGNAPVVRSLHPAAELAHHGARRQRGAGAGQHRRVGRDHRDAADHRRAGDVSRSSRPAVRGRPRERRRDGAVDQLVPGRRRDRVVLRDVRADRQPEPDRRRTSRSTTC